MTACSLRTLLLCLAGVSFATLAETPRPTTLPGTAVSIPAIGDVTQENDEAHLTLMVEEQDKDKSVAASRVNLKMKQGADAVKRSDPKAILRTRGYYTYPVYADDAPQQRAPLLRSPIAWRIGQYLEVVTANLAGLPKTVADAQGALAVSALNFGLSVVAVRRLDEKRIAAAYQNLNDRIGAVARAMGRNPGNAVLESVDLDGAGAFAHGSEVALSSSGLRSAVMAPPLPGGEPSFEPGETSLQMRLVAKVRFQ